MAAVVPPGEAIKCSRCPVVANPKVEASRVREEEAVVVVVFFVLEKEEDVLPLLPLLLPRCSLSPMRVAACTATLDASANAPLAMPKSSKITTTRRDATFDIRPPSLL